MIHIIEPYIFNYLIFIFHIYFQNRLRGSGHGIAAARMDAKLNTAGWIAEQMGGVRLVYLSCFQEICLMANLCILQLHLSLFQHVKTLIQYLNASERFCDSFTLISALLQNMLMTCERFQSLLETSFFV